MSAAFYVIIYNEYVFLEIDCSESWDRLQDHGVMGFVEVIRKLPSIFKLRSDFGKLMDERKPDCLLIVDYPGFNMKLAQLAHDKGIPVVSYIAPSAWAWNKGRAKKVAKIVNKVACIFPFEYDVYKEAGAPVEFVGHPLVDIVHPERRGLERSLDAS